MPYCPKCRDEFQDWVKICPDCKVALVAELPPKRKPTRKQSREKPMIPIATAPNEVIASLWSAVLEDNGIRCFIKGGDLVAAWYLPRIGAPHEIHVLASDAKKARQIIKPFVKS